MLEWVSQTAIRRARRVCLYDFLVSRHPDDVEREGDSLRLASNHSVSVRRGYAGYMDFADGSTGNAIEYLMNYLSYDFQSAVASLCEFDGMAQDEISGSNQSLTLAGLITAPQTTKPASRVTQESFQDTQQDSPRIFVPPDPFPGPYRQLYAYLTRQRGIPPALIQMLIDDGILYQSKDHGNIIFIDPARTFVEYRGSNSEKKFHRIDFSDASAFWWFKPCGLFSNPTVAYICEGAIDAISLYLLLSIDSATRSHQALYCGIGGVANQQRIDRIKIGMSAAGCQTIIAVDNDKAGALCRQRNSDCNVLVPHRKDWNEDLLAYEHQYKTAFDWLNGIVTAHRKGDSH